MGTTTCSNCRSVNQTGGIACVNCGELLVDPESVERRTRGRSTPAAEVEPSPEPIAGIEPATDPSIEHASTTNIPAAPKAFDTPPRPPMPVPSDAFEPETAVVPPRPHPPTNRIGLGIAIAIGSVALFALFVLVVLKYKT